MESELFKDSTFLNDTKLGKTTSGVARTRKSTKKENITPENLKKVKQVVKKEERKPLKPLNKENKIDNSSKINDVTPKKRGRPSKTSKPEIKNEKVTRSAPKIIIHQDSPVKGTKKEGRKTFGGLSKSWDGSEKRQNLKETQKSPKGLTVKNQTHRHSLNDLDRIKSPNKKENLPKVKTPTKSKPRVSGPKPGQPEFDEMMKKLETFFPNVDPEYLKSIFLKFKRSLSRTIEFIILKEKTKELPTKYEYVKRTEIKKLEEKFWENFSIEKFVEMIPNPWEYFLKEEKHNRVKYVDHSLYYLKNKFKKHYVRTIQTTLSNCDNSLYLAHKELSKNNHLHKMRATNRTKYECEVGKPGNFDAQYLYEVAFIENESKIKSHIKKVETARDKKFKKAQQEGSLLKCESCNDFNLLPDDAVNCPANHVFCKVCVVKYVEVEMGKDNFQFKCLMVNCKEEFSLDSLQAVLKPFVMSTIIKRNQMEKIQSAESKDLVTCPFCNFVMVVPQEISDFKCLNPSCMLDNCRYNEEMDNLDKTIVNVQVEEKEKKEDEDRIYKCVHCKGHFEKTEDPNRRVCPCGTSMCCVCYQLLPYCNHDSHTHGLSSSEDTDCDEVEEMPEEESNGEFGNDLEFLPSESETF